MEKLQKETEAKLKMLQFTNGKSHSIVEKGNIEAVERHRDTLRTLVKDMHALKLQVEQSMFESGDSQENVAKWSTSVEEKVDEVQNEISQIDMWLTEIKHQTERKKEKKEEEKEARAREEQLQFEREQMKIKLEFEQQLEAARANQPAAKTDTNVQTKLPKLEITKFKGTYEEWLPFWNKFQAEIEKTSLAPVTKFAYLKELLHPKVRTEIDGLPFTTEGYERAKNILSSEYGKTSEIVNAYIQNIMNLPVITGTQPERIQEFYKTLLYNVQSLETLGKLRDVSGNIRSVLDKLKGIKADLVRGHEDWQN